VSRDTAEYCARVYDRRSVLISRPAHAHSARADGLVVVLVGAASNMASLAAFMDAVVIVIVDPVQYQRRRDERDDVSMPLRSLHFGPDGGGLVRFLVYPPDDLVLVVKSSGSAVSDVWLSPGGLMPPGAGML
jgi:hypothetical protein